MVGYGVIFITKDDLGNDVTHHCTELGLHMTKKVIGIPAPKTFLVDVYRTNGMHDLTEYVADGRPKYSNRQITIEFEVEDAINRWNEVYNEVLDIINGEIIRLIFDDDNHYIYKGRVKINRFTTNSYFGTISMTVDAEPYKTKKDTYKTEYEFGELILDGHYVKQIITRKWLWNELNFVNGKIDEMTYIVTMADAGKTISFHFDEDVDEVLVYVEGRWYRSNWDGIDDYYCESIVKYNDSTIDWHGMLIKPVDGCIDLKVTWAGNNLPNDGTISTIVFESIRRGL